MKTLFFLLITTLFCSDISQLTHERINFSINPIIGNVSLNHIPKAQLNNLDDKEKVKTHLTYVYNYLLKESVNYPEEIKRKRLYILSILSDYIAAGNYPENAKYEGRRPCFIDDSNTYCAVGHLIKETSGKTLAKAINKKHQYDYIYDMDFIPLDDWIAKSGFTKQEIAMIQPTYDFYRPRKYHTASVSTEVRNGNFPNFGWGYHYITYRSQGSKLGGHFMRSYSAIINHYQDRGWSASAESERSLFAIKKIGLSLNSGLGAKYVNLDAQHYLQGLPSASLNMIVRRNKRLFFDFGTLYQYSIPLINQNETSLNRHTFVFRFRVGYSRN